MFEPVELLVRQHFFLDVNLDAPAGIFHIGEQTFPHVPVAHQPAGNSHIAFRHRVRAHRSDGFRQIKPTAVRINPQL